MRRFGTVAAVALLCFLGVSCHKRALPAPPSLPAAGASEQQPAPETNRPRATTQPATTQPRETVPSQPAPAQPTQPAQPPRRAEPEFRLGQTITPEEQRTNNALVDRHLQRASQALATIEKRPLTTEQKSTVAQIREFMEQARQMRATDVLRARSLAERADVLTQDLLSRTRGK